MRPSLNRPADGGGAVDVVTRSEFRRYAVGRGALAWNPGMANFFPTSYPVKVSVV